jgi:type IV secretion system protein VirD4
MSIPPSSAALPSSRLLLGRTRSEPDRRPTIGFAAHSAVPVPTASRPLSYSGEGHLLTVAPTGAGKGRSAIIPNLLSYSGPVICIDPKSENTQVTARRRRDMGQQVVILDPFRTVTDRGDALNPFDLFALPGSELDSDSEMLMDLITGGELTLGKDPFWDLTAGGLLTGLIGYAAEQDDPKKRNLGTAFDLLHHDDVDYNLAVILDTFTFRTPLIRQEIVGYLSHESDRCRPSVRSTAQAKVKTLCSEAARRSLLKSTFDLQAVVRGDPLTIFLVLPPEKLHSHRAILRLWLGVLLTAVMRRRHRTPQKTLFILDECAQLGPMPLLRQALTLLRGYGVQAWTFWQDLSQLKQLYPQDWQAIVNNSAVTQVFGMTSHLMAAECAALLGVSAEDLLRLPAGTQMLHRAGEGVRTARRLDYLRDRRFSGHFDANRRFLGGPAL